MGDAVAVVDFGATQVGGGDVLAHDVAHDGGAGEEHRRSLGHHHEVGEGGRVGAAAGAGAADHRDLRDAARQVDVLAEDAAVAGQRGQALLHARTARLDEADDGHAGAPGQAQDADDRLRVLLAQRAAEVGRVLGVAEHGPVVDAAGAGDHAVTRARLVAHALGHDVRAQERKGALVAERLQAPDRRQPAVFCDLRGLVGLGRPCGRRVSPSGRRKLLPTADVRCDGGDAHSAASRQRTALWPPKPNALDSATGGLPLTTSGRALFGT